MMMVFIAIVKRQYVDTDKKAVSNNDNIRNSSRKQKKDSEKLNTARPKTKVATLAGRGPPHLGSRTDFR